MIVIIIFYPRRSKVGLYIEDALKRFDVVEGVYNFLVRTHSKRDSIKERSVKRRDVLNLFEIV